MDIGNPLESLLGYQNSGAVLGYLFRSLLVISLIFMMGVPLGLKFGYEENRYW